MAATLYDRLGGEAAVLADELTKPFFGELDMQAQIKKQLAFMTRAFGGPDAYKGRDLREAHAGLVKRGLGDAHFNAVARHLKETLEEMGVEAALITEALAMVATTRTAVLGR
jgi:hemoglobin